MPLKEEFITYISREEGHATSHRATWGALGFGHEAEADVENLGQNLYWGLCRKGKAEQGKPFGIGQLESSWQALGCGGGL